MLRMPDKKEQDFATEPCRTILTFGVVSPGFGWGERVGVSNRVKPLSTTTATRELARGSEGHDGNRHD